MDDIEDTKPVEKKVVKKKAKAKLDKENEVLVKNTIDINPTLDEAVDKTVVLGWGRMNPITVGHEKLVNKIKAVARKSSATAKIYISHTQDAKKNPLAYDDKIMLAKKAFGNNVIEKSNSKTIIQIMQELQSKYSKVIMVVGQDRISDFNTLLNKYNGKDYKFDNIEVVSAGDRDPDADDVTGMSASKMRALAVRGDLKAFKTGLPRKLQGDAQEVYDMVRGGMKIAEEMELDEAVLTVQQRRNRGIVMRKYKNKIAAARKRLSKKAATMTMLKSRARKAAIKIIRKKIAGKKGEKYASLSPSEKMMIDKRVSKKKAAIDKIAKKILPSVRKADLARLNSKSKNEQFEDLFGDNMINESFESFLIDQQFDEKFESPKVKRFHQMLKKDGTIKLDARFRAFKKKPEAQELEEISINTDAERTLKTHHKDERKNLSREHEREMDGLLTRELRKKVRSINKAEPRTEEFADESALINFIEETANDIFDQVTLDEQKIENSLQAKSDKSGVELEIIQYVYEEAMESYVESETMDIQQWAFSVVNATLANLDEGKKGGLWDNIHKKRKRIKAGSKEKMRKPGSDGAPTNDDFENARSEDVNEAFAELFIEKSPIDMVKGKLGLKLYKKQYQHALSTLKDLVSRKKKETSGPKGSMRHDIGYYAAQIAKSYKNVDSKLLAGMMSEEGGAGDRGTEKVTKRYKKDTPGETVTESVNDLFEAHFKVEIEGLPDMFINAKGIGEVKAEMRKKLKKPDDVKNIERVTPDKIKKHFRMLVRGDAEDATAVNEDVTQTQLNDLEKFGDRLLAKFKIDIEFTRHFADRMNDTRNKPAITVAELQKVFKKIAKRKAVEIRQNPDSEAVLKDMQADLNLPIVINYDKDKDEYEVVNKTIMRKKNFGTSDKVIEV
tara:strand:+ start:360 stop:3056 length:2697 start_codon:yes stop_codon:yes gene_type:complete